MIFPSWKFLVSNFPWVESRDFGTASEGCYLLFICLFPVKIILTWKLKIYFSKIAAIRNQGMGGGLVWRDSLTSQKLEESRNWRLHVHHVSTVKKLTSFLVNHGYNRGLFQIKVTTNFILTVQQNYNGEINQEINAATQSSHGMLIKCATTTLDLY